VLVWLLTAPVAFLLPTYAGLNPFYPKAVGLSIGAALAAVAVGLAVALRFPRPIWPPVAAGLLASWTILALRVSLHGTPFGFGGLRDDAGRISAMAVRHSATWVPSDAWIPGLPAEYPPLYFLVTGRLAALLDIPAWSLLADVAAFVIAGTVVVLFLLWQRLVPGWVAVAVAAVAVVAYLDPRKPYETFTLAIFVPWVLLAIGRPARGLHWLPAGVLGAVIATTYQAWLVFGALGAATVALLTWRTATDRRAYLRHLAGVVVTAAVLSAWYVVPFEWAVLTKDGRMISDQYLFGSVHDNVFPFLAATPLGVLQLVGLVGLLWLRTSTPWATPLLAITVGTLAFRVLATIRLVASGHTSFMAYSAALVIATLTAAGAVVIGHAGRHIVARFKPAPGLGAAALALLLAWSTYTTGRAWMPDANQPLAQATQAHLEPRPDGTYPRHAPADGRAPWFPVEPIEQAVESVLGPDPQRVSLSYDERLYAFLPWPGYTTVSRTASGTLARWDSRMDEITRIAAIRDPVEFAHASATTQFGPIDIFVLKRDGDDWLWRTTRFSREQFDTRAWVVFDDLPGDTVVAVRRS